MWARHLSEAELTQGAEGELTGARLRRAEDHLRTCRACAEALEQARAMARLLLTLPPALPPYDLRDRILSRVTAQPLPEMRCKQALALIHESLDKPLSPLSAGFLRLHLDTCPDCNFEHATLAAATRAVRSLRPVSAPVDLRQAAYARVPARPASSLPRLRSALASAAVAAAALFLVLRSTPQQEATPRPAAVRPPVVVSAPQPSAQPEVALPAPVEQPASIAEAPVERRNLTSVSAAAPTPRPGRPRASARPPIIVVSLPQPSPEPIVGDPGPRALRALRAVASAAAYDFTPHVSLASVGERLATLDSEAVATALPESFPTGLPTDSPTPSRNHESGASSDQVPSNLARLMEGTSRPA